MGGILRLPAAFVTTVNGRSGRSGLSAFRAEISLVHGSAGTGPACRGTGLSTLRTEFSGVHRAAAAGPASGGLRRLGGTGCLSIPVSCAPGLNIPALCILHARRVSVLPSCILRASHLIELRRIEAASLSGHVHPGKSHHGAGGRVPGGCAHGVRLCAHQCGRRHVGIPQDGGFLHVADHLFILFRSGHAADAKGSDGNSAQMEPFFAQHLIQRIRNLSRVAGQGAVTDSHFRNLREGRLQRSHQLAFQHAVQIVSGIGALHVAANICVKAERIHNTIGILPMAPDRNVHIQTDVRIHHAERHRIGRAVFISHDFLRIKIVHPLIPWRFPAKGEADTEQFKGFPDIFSQISIENGRLRRHIINIFSRFGTDLHHLPLIHDHHALAFINRNDGAIGNDVFRSFPVGAPSGRPFLALHCQNLLRQAVAVKIFLPLISEYR